MSTEAIGATALGGEGDTIAVASSLHLDSRATTAATSPPAATRVSTGPAAVTAAAAAPSSTSTTSTRADRPTGLHSPPDSNNASKLDGGSSDSELSELDDDVLADALDMHPDAAEPAAVAGLFLPASGSGSADADAGGAPTTHDAAEQPVEDDDDIGEIDPDHYSGTVPVFKPNMHQFQDFKKFMEKIDKYGMKSGIVKIIPPQEWKDSLAPLDEMVKTIKVREPIKQDIMGSNGIYRQVNILHQRTYNLPQWRQLCDQSEHQPPARRGERRANADKPRPPPRSRAPASGTPVAAVAGTGSSGPRKGKRGSRAARKKTQRRSVADDDTASVVSEPRPMTPESQRGDDDRMMDDDKTCVETPEDTAEDAGKTQEDKTQDKPADQTVIASVETDRPIKKEDDDAEHAEDMCSDIPAVPRRVGFTRQASAKTQSTSARRKYLKREGSAKIDEAAFKDFDYRMDVTDYTPERCEELERIYWKTLTYAPPLYGADLPGTLFDDSMETWNLNKLPNLLDVLGTRVPGVNTAYLYLGMWKATFAWHLEDVDLYSINYLHFGAPKQWYSISQGDARRFEAAMKNIWPTDAKACDQFLRHKAFLISPSHLQHHYNIRVNKCVSYPGEFVVTYPYGYHSGYNLGYNCAEAVNFALESWLPMGKIAKKCECAQAQDSVWVDVYEIERKLRGISTDDEDDEDDDSDEYMDDADGGDNQARSGTGLPTPPAGGRVRIRAPTRKRKRRETGDKDGDDRDDGTPEDRAVRASARKLKKMRLRLQSAEGAPCCLCPNDIPGADILPTDDGRKAHRICALYLPEPYIEVIDGQDVVTNVGGFSASRLELKCMYCRCRRGVCFQCTFKKCSRTYHPTCAAAAGVFVEEGYVPVFGEDGTEYKEQTFQFTCRFQRTKRDRKLDGEALQKNERIRAAAAALQKGAVCQMQLYRSDIFAGVVLENRPDEEMLLLHVIPSGEHVEVDWRWLLLPDASDYRLPKASPNALPLPRSRKEQEEIGAKKRPVPVPYDEFVQGYTWQEFNTCDAYACDNKDQVQVDLSRPNKLWHYIGKTSTDTKAYYSEDPANPIHNSKSNFLENGAHPAHIPMQPPMRPPLPSAALAAVATPGVPPPPFAPCSADAAGLASAEPRRSYSIIKPPYVPHTSPTTSAIPAPLSTSTSPPAGPTADKSYIYGPRKSSDSFPTPRRPASKQQLGGDHPHRHRSSSSSSHRPPFGPFFSLPAAGNNSGKFPQIQHPNLSHGYAAIPMAKKPAAVPGSSTSPSAMSPPPAKPSAEGSRDATALPPPPPKPASLPTSTAQKYSFFQTHGNRDSSSYRSPYSPYGGFANSSDNAMRIHTKGRRSSSSRMQHRRGASSASSASSFGLGFGLSGLTRPSPHTNYVGQPPPPSSTASSPYLSAMNLNFGTGPGSSSSYASYDSMMGGMSPHSPQPIDASPFVGSPGPQISGFEFPPTGSSSASYHTGMRPQFGPAWQQSFQTPLFAQDMNDLNFSQPSPITPATGLGAPANIVPGHHHSMSFSGTTMAGGSPIDTSSTGGFGNMSPSYQLDSPMAMSPVLDAAEPPADGGTNQSPAEQLKQQLRSISDSSLPSSYRLRCLHQPRRRHQSRSSLNRIFTSQLLDLNPT